MSIRREISDEDVRAAMQEVEGYLDISLRDFRELYRHAVRLAEKRLLSSTPIVDIMTTEVVTVLADTPFEEVIAAMAAKPISGMPVVDADTRVIGVVSEKDIFARLDDSREPSFWRILGGCLECNKCLLRSLRGVRAADIMTAPPLTVTSMDSARIALELMRRSEVNRLPVVDTGGKLCGIVTRSDLLQATLVQTEA